MPQVQKSLPNAKRLTADRPQKGKPLPKLVLFLVSLQARNNKRVPSLGGKTKKNRTPRCFWAPQKGTVRHFLADQTKEGTKVADPSPIRVLGCRLGGPPKCGTHPPSTAPCSSKLSGQSCGKDGIWVPSPVFGWDLSIPNSAAVRPAVHIAGKVTKNHVRMTNPKRVTIGYVVSFC